MSYKSDTLCSAWAEEKKIDFHITSFTITEKFAGPSWRLKSWWRVGNLGSTEVSPIEFIGPIIYPRVVEQNTYKYNLWAMTVPLHTFSWLAMEGEKKREVYSLWMFGQICWLLLFSDLLKLLAIGLQESCDFQQHFLHLVFLVWV